MYRFLGSKFEDLLHFPPFFGLRNFLNPFRHVFHSRGLQGRFRSSLVLKQKLFFPLTRKQWRGRSLLWEITRLGDSAVTVDRGRIRTKYFRFAFKITFRRERRFAFVKMSVIDQEEARQEFDIVLKVLGERQRTEEAHAHSEHYEHLTRSLLDMLTKEYGDRLTFRIYGSTAEDLKCLEPNNLGDVDIMLFPNVILIHDELIEYSRHNPLYVRIKGSNDLVLKNCLEEDTEYVSTSAIRSFDPAIYGHFAYDIGQVMPVEEFANGPGAFLKCSCYLEEHRNTPAIPVNVYFVRLWKTKLPRHLETTIGAPSGNIGNMTDIKRVDVNEKEEASPTDDVRRHSLPPTDDSSSHDLMLDQNQDKKDSSVGFYARLMEHLFPSVSKARETQFDDETSFEGNEELPSIHQQVLSPVDFVPAFKCQGWPKVAEEWPQRKRKWPSPKTVDKVIQEGFHLVVKAPPNGGDHTLDFRLSFSHAEYLLSQEMNDVQRECYRCLKKIYRSHLMTVSRKNLVTFHLKTILLHAIEETGPEMWTDSNRAECMMHLLGNLLEALRTKYLRHYFVRSYNLFCSDYFESNEILESLEAVVSQIMKDPLYFTKKLIQDVNRTKQDAKKKSTPTSEPAFFEDPTIESKHGEEKKAFFTSEEKDRSVFDPVLVTKFLGHHCDHALTKCHFHNLKNHFIATFIEVFDKAFFDPDYPPELLNSLERSTVEDLRNLWGTLVLTRRDHEQFAAAIETYWNVFGHINVLTGMTSKHHVLMSLKRVTRLLSYFLKDKNCARDSEAINRKVMEDCFDLNLLVPAGFGYVLLQNLLKWLESEDNRKILSAIILEFGPKFIEVFTNTYFQENLPSLTVSQGQPQILNLKDIPLD